MKKMKKALKVLAAFETFKTVFMLLISLDCINKYNFKKLFEEAKEYCCLFVPSETIGKNVCDLIHKYGAGIYDFEAKLKLKEVKVKYNPFFFLLRGLTGSICGILPTGQIFCEGFYLMLTRNAKAFTLLHECGHYLHKHMERYVDGNSSYIKHRIILALKGEVLIDELEADAFAVQQIGAENAISALKEVRRLLIFNPIGYIEVTNRIKSIKNNIK